ncbi:uncharacterized protein LOC134216994 [Armigeres subalbatus]|uniref:uncharacterized protein LOC134216994 n=1 Tax=Armigeres subalbatus TaxID=124917 RepID=UPI002ED43040
MSFVVKCAVCKQNLPYTHSQTTVLVEHLLESHPEQHFSISRVIKEQVRESSEEHLLPNVMTNAPKSKNRKLSQDSTRSEFRMHRAKRMTGSGKLADENLPDKQDFTTRRPKGRKMFYKTSVATWRPARCRAVCPHCGELQYPTIRMTADRYSQSVYGATWIMTCWPFCFLPCLFTAPTKRHLHCSKCNAYLGLYNPNQEVVTTCNTRRKSSPPGGSH